MLHPLGWRLTLITHTTPPHATVSVSQCDPDAAVTAYTQAALEEDAQQLFSSTQIVNPPNPEGSAVIVQAGRDTPNTFV